MIVVVGLKKSVARIVVMLQYVGGSLKLLPDDPDRLPVDYTTQVMAGLERILDAHQVTVVPDMSRPVLTAHQVKKV